MNEEIEKRLDGLLSKDKLSVLYKLIDAIDSLYDVDKLWDKGFGEWKKEYKYRRGGKTLCTIYVKEDAACLLITYGKVEREKFEGIKTSVSVQLQDIYDKTDTLHDGKWMWIPIDENICVEDIVRMLAIKRRPNRGDKSFCC